MTLEMVRTVCLKFPGATEQIQWGNDLVFKVGGKMFAVGCLEAGHENVLSFKCSPEEFAQLIECEGIIPAPYLARARWVALKGFDILSTTELKQRLRDSYDLVFAALPKRAQAELGNGAVTRTPPERLTNKKASATRKKKK